MAEIAFFRVNYAIMSIGTDSIYMLTDDKIPSVIFLKCFLHNDCKGTKKMLEMTISAVF